MSNINYTIKTSLSRLGADIVGFGDLCELPVDVREGMPVGISVAAAYPKDIIRGISELPTPEYHEWYDKLNNKLDLLVTCGAEILRKMGYNAMALTRAYTGTGENGDNTTLPYKTVATRAGIGWIGKSALLVNSEFGSAIRLSTILTDAPLLTALPVNESRCGNCMVCRDACPAGAVSGKLWEVSLKLDDFFNPIMCRRTARERSRKGFGEDLTICGKCIEICPHTQRYIKYDDK